MPDHNELFAQNLAALQAFDRGFAQALEAYKNLDGHVIEADAGRELSILVDALQLTSHHSQEWSFKERLKPLDLTMPVHVYGMGLGYEIRGLLKHPEVPEITLHVLCPVLMLQLMGIDDEFPSILAPRVRLSLDTSAQIHRNRLVNLTELRLENGFANALKLRLQSALDEHYARKLFERTVGARIGQKIRTNAPLLLSEDFFKKSELEPHAQVAVIASGPSLEAEFERLVTLRHKGFYTVAVDTALIFLERQGFIPDAVVSIDDLASRQSGRLFFKERAPYKNTLLLYAPSSDPKLWLEHPGKRRCLISDRALEAVPELKSKLGDRLYSSGSVTLTAVALALELGARQIALIGLDFAYLGDQVHAGMDAKGDFLTGGKAELAIRCNDGQLRPTQRNFAVYRLDLEDLIALHPKTEFINLSRRGAVIKGAKAL